MTLTEFLEARIAEDEDHATDSMAALDRAGLASYGARVLAECEAKRRIVAWAKRWPTRPPKASDGIAAEGALLSLLALPYASHPDYLADWATS